MYSYVWIILFIIIYIIIIFPRTQPPVPRCSLLSALARSVHSPENLTRDLSTWSLVSTFYILILDDRYLVSRPLYINLSSIIALIPRYNHDDDQYNQVSSRWCWAGSPTFPWARASPPEKMTSLRQQPHQWHFLLPGLFDLDLDHHCQQHGWCHHQEQRGMWWWRWWWWRWWMWPGMVRVHSRTHRVPGEDLFLTVFILIWTIPVLPWLRDRLHLLPLLRWDLSCTLQQGGI